MKEKFKSWAFSKEHGKCDVITLIIYLLGVCTVSFFHEPWFDEAQSWAIARSGTIKGYFLRSHTMRVTRHYGI